jgi:gamma-glutamyltranspeptidase/glutathione hydrolase
MPWGLELGLSPFFGVLGLAPPPAWGRISTIEPRAHGGNLDNKELVAGSTLYLPVHVEGAMFSCGDGHGAQGDGEVCVTAIETALEGRFRLTVLKDRQIRYPQAETPTHYITMGMAPDLETCVQMALRDMITLVSARARISRNDAYMLCSLAGDLRITQTVNREKGVHMMMAKHLLDTPAPQDTKAAHLMKLSAHHPYPSRRSAVLADHMVATSQPLAAQAGLAMLARGGNAVDAALATAITLTLVEPSGNGVGSDAFAIVWDGHELHGLNASGRAPEGWTPDRFSQHAEMPFRGWESVTVPGAVSAWVALSERFGALPFADLFAPAISYAEHGFIVTPVIAQLWRRAADELAEQPGFAEAFLPDGTPPTAGTRFKNPALAKTLSLIAATKGDAFYNGPLAEAICAFAALHGAALNAADMAAHTVDWCGTISRTFDDVTLHEIPPNGQGIAALMALGILSHTRIRDLGPDDPLALHLQIEAMKLALVDAETYVADAAHMTPVSAQALLDDGYLAARAQLIDETRAQDFGAGAPKQGGTVYLSTADASGMMVSFIQSNYAGFGSGVVIPDTGISMQNRGAGFTLDPASPNCVGPNKRPFHTIIPGFLMGPDGPLMSFGVMGGPMQAQGHVQMVLRTQIWGQDPQMAIDAPRWRFVERLQVAVEEAMPAPLRAALAGLGHDIALEAPDNAFGFGGAQLIQRLPQGGFAAGSDPRKDGCAVGF